MILLFFATLLCVIATAGAAIADFVSADFVVKTSETVNVSLDALPYLGALQLAGAVGLVMGLVAVPWLGVAAGVGLILYYTGAAVFHIRARIDYTIGGAFGFLGLSALATVYLVNVAIGA